MLDGLSIVGWYGFWMAGIPLLIICSITLLVRLVPKNITNNREF